MSKEITQYEAAGLDEKMRYVQTLTSAGNLIPTGLHDKGQPSPGKVLLVLETGAMLGIHPMAALGGIHIIEGKPSISPGLMSGLVRKAGHKLRVTTTGTIRGGDFAATASLTRSDDLDFTYTATWTLDRATRAGLAGKSVWKNYGEAMCKARAISEVIREGAEDVLMGVSYTPEEMGALVTDGGELVEVKDEPSEDWAAQIEAATTRDEMLVIRNRATESGEYANIRHLVLAKIGVIGRAEAPAPGVPVATDERTAGEVYAERELSGQQAREYLAAAAAPVEDIVDAEVVEDEPAPTEPAEMTQEEYEAASAAEHEAAVAANG